MDSLFSTLIAIFKEPLSRHGAYINAAGDSVNEVATLHPESVRFVRIPIHHGTYQPYEILQIRRKPFDQASSAH